MYKVKSESIGNYELHQQVLLRCALLDVFDRSIASSLKTSLNDFRAASQPILQFDPERR